MRDVLLLDLCDLQVQAAGERLRRAIADVHVEVHCLLLGCRNGQRVQVGNRMADAQLQRLAHVIVRMPMLQNGRPAWHDLS